MSTPTSRSTRHSEFLTSDTTGSKGVADTMLEDGPETGPKLYYTSEDVNAKERKRELAQEETAGWVVGRENIKRSRSFKAELGVKAPGVSLSPNKGYSLAED